MCTVSRDGQQHAGSRFDDGFEIRLVAFIYISLAHSNINSYKKEDMERGLVRQARYAYQRERIALPNATKCTFASIKTAVMFIL